MTASPLAQTPNDMFNAPIAEADPEIAEVLNAELSRQQNGLEMIASENFVPRAVLQAQGSVLTNKYAEGYPGRRYYGGCEQVDKIETIARERAKSLFGAEYVNVQPHSGAQANAAVYQALVKPGDTVLGLALDHGGHLTHGMKINFSGRFYHAEAYGVNPETFRIDPEIIRQRALETHPAMIIGGWSAYPRIEDFKAMKEIADEVGAKFWVDMAHFAGLVAAGLHPSPVPYADVVSSTAHKTLGGPRSGFILAKQDYAKKLNSAVFPGQQGGPLMHVIAGKAVAFKVAASPEFKYRMQHRSVRSASGKRGFRSAHRHQRPRHPRLRQQGIRRGRRHHRNRTRSRQGCRRGSPQGSRRQARRRLPAVSGSRSDSLIPCRITVDRERFRI